MQRYQTPYKQIDTSNEIASPQFDDFHHVFVAQTANKICFVLGKPKHMPKHPNQQKISEGKLSATQVIDVQWYSFAP